MADARAFRALARVERDPRKRVRFLAVANVWDGMTVEEAARAGGMGRASLYRWLARERTGGPAALGDRPRSGRRRKLDAEQRAEVKAWGLAGPDLRSDGIVAWRGGDVRAMIERRFGVKLALSSTYRLLGELHLSALVPATAMPTRRPRPPFSKLPGARRRDRRRFGPRHPGRGLVSR